MTATGPDHAWAFASTLARPVAWRLTGHRWAAVPFPGQAGDLVTAAASSAWDNVWAFTARPAGAGRALRCGEPLQVVPDGSGGLWIPAVAGFPGTFAMLHYSRGHLRPARLPRPATRLAVGAVAHVAGSAVTFGGGASYRPGQRGTRQSGVILRYGG